MAKSLDTLLAQVNALAPSRDKSSDGGIGNAEHASRSSDHNPWVQEAGVGIVTARDFTNDPAGGMSSQALADALVASKDERIKCIISNRKICSGTKQDKPAWVWRPYTGSNPHNHHCHISVKSDKVHYDDVSSWTFTLGEQAASAPTALASFQTLRKGDSGLVVLRLQNQLNANGARVALDGLFGPGTELAVKKFQGLQKIVADGIVGRYTWEALRRESNAK